MTPLFRVEYPPTMSNSNWYHRDNKNCAQMKSKLSTAYSVLINDGFIVFVHRVAWFFVKLLFPSYIQNIVYSVYVRRKMSNLGISSYHNIYSGKTILDDISDTFGTDKGGEESPVTWDLHSYTPIYDLILTGLRPERVLECGIGDYYDANNDEESKRNPGASLRMWSEYFQDADIYGIDIDPAKLFKTDRIQTYEVDQTSPKSIDSFLKEIGSNLTFDIIIDDGLHTGEAAVILFDRLYERLSLGGYYIIEDLKLNQADIFVDFINGSNYTYNLTLINNTNDSLIILRKPLRHDN